VQWLRPAFRVRRAGPAGFPHDVARHATPLFRDLAGVDDALQQGKVVNLRLAAASLDGLVLRPGDRLSVWRQVGPPTVRRGFVPGLVLRQGTLGAGVGGGMCQLTNLLYWMTLHSPLTVVERWRHSYDVFPDDHRTQPFGSGATCAFPGLDLQVENRTDVAFRLSVRVAEGRLEGSWTAGSPVPERYEVYEAEHAVAEESPGVRVRRNVLRRRVLDPGGALVLDEEVARNEARVMYAGLDA
jgi:vancomycin resistance protein VanW